MKTIVGAQVPLLYVAGGAAVIVLVAGIGGYSDYKARAELARTRQDFASTTTAFTARVGDLSDRLAAAENENVNLHVGLQVEAEKNTAYGAQVGSLVSTVNMLDKLSKTDRELLQKYSAVYFLNDNYVPSSLTNIDPQYVWKKDVTLEIHTQIKPHLQALMEAANAGGAPILILSAYRSFGQQANLKTTYKITYGAGTANSFSADQGYSEHQLGSAMDFTTQKGGDNLDPFEKSPGFSWLQEHAHEYGFILSYPKGNQYFTYEPWHWRYVGVELATKLHTEGKYFYGLDQREINQYLVKIFD